MSDPDTQELPAIPPSSDQNGPLVTAEADEEDWLAPPPKRGVRLKLVTLVLLVAAAAAGAFWTGTVVQKHNGPASTSGSAAALISRFRSAAAGAGAGGAGSGGGFGASRVAPTASGTLTDMTGTTLYLTDASGALIKVVTTPSTTVTRTGVGQPGTLTIGDTITVEGTKGTDGTVTATRVVATAQGVSATGSGGAAGGQGGGAPAGPGGSSGGG
jgi:hypothetical protein